LGVVKVKTFLESSSTELGLDRGTLST